MAVLQAGTLWRVATARMPTKWGMLEAVGFERDGSSDGQRVEGSRITGSPKLKQRGPASDMSSLRGIDQNSAVDLTRRARGIEAQL
jgi:hypothetical protein